jgi:acetyl esterase/lipase
MGDSAGGGLALSLLLRLRDEGIPLPPPLSRCRPGPTSRLPVSRSS